MSKVIRDPIWGDIKLHDEEVSLVDTDHFQRLRGIKQLGLAYLIYPGATHSRFLHSIGTVAASQSILTAIGSEDTKFDQETERNIRLVALLHDLGHTPFSHLLEDEAGLYPRHDKPERLRPVLESLESSLPQEVRDALLGILPRERMFIQDAVSNTICADLIDYIQRDGHFSGATGLRFKFDERLLGFFRQARDGAGATRLAIEPVKDKIRLDVITDLLQLLRYRYILTERITYHHAKLAASAMLVKAVTSEGAPDLSAFREMSDDEFLHFISTRGKVAGRLIEKLKRRRLHKPVYRLTRRAVSKVMTVERFAEKYGSPEGRTALEKQILDEASKIVAPRTLNEGDVVVYTSPDYRMTFKEVSVLVRWKGEEAIPLREVPPEEYWETVTLNDVTALEDKYGALWTAGIFVDFSLRDVTYEMEKACERVLGMDNDPLLRRALGKDSSYGDMVLAQRMVDDIGLARTAVTISQRTKADATPDERMRKAVEEAIRLRSKGAKPGQAETEQSKGLEDFGDERRR